MNVGAHDQTKELDLVQSFGDRSSDYSLDHHLGISILYARFTLCCWQLSPYVPVSVFILPPGWWMHVSWLLLKWTLVIFYNCYWRGFYLQLFMSGLSWHTGASLYIQVLLVAFALFGLFLHILHFIIWYMELFLYIWVQIVSFLALHLLICTLPFIVWYMVLLLIMYIYLSIYCLIFFVFFTFLCFHCYTILSLLDCGASSCCHYDINAIIWYVFFYR